MVTCNIGSTLISYCQENLTKCRKVTWDGLTSHLEEKYNTLTHFMLVKVVLLLLSLCEDHLALCQFPFTCQILNLVSHSRQSSMQFSSAVSCHTIEQSFKLSLRVFIICIRLCKPYCKVSF